jgi:membrane associated rhomboid family serine protease
VYFLSGLAGSALVLLVSNIGAATVGASGAIFGLFGALFIVTLHSHDFQTTMMRGSLGAIILINLLFTFFAGGISWQAHIGGLIGGVLTMEAMLHFGRRSIGREVDGGDLGWSLVVLAGIVAVIALRVITFPTF